MQGRSTLSYLHEGGGGGKPRGERERIQTAGRRLLVFLRAFSSFLYRLDCVLSLGECVRANGADLEDGRMIRSDVSIRCCVLSSRSRLFYTLG